MECKLLCRMVCNSIFYITVILFFWCNYYYWLEQCRRWSSNYVFLMWTIDFFKYCYFSRNLEIFCIVCCIQSMQSLMSFLCTVQLIYLSVCLSPHFFYRATYFLYFSQSTCLHFYSYFIFFSTTFRMYVCFFLSAFLLSFLSFFLS